MRASRDFARDGAADPVIAAGPLALVVFACGLGVDVRLDVGGEIFLAEPMLLGVALQCLLARGTGRQFVPSIFVSYLVAGLLTFAGYLLADLVAANEAWQYLKGWGRVALLIVDSAALMLVAAQERRLVWWLALGMGIGGICSLALQGVAPDQWKLGYGEYAALLVVTIVALAPAWLSIPALFGFGASCIFLDYRSLGATCIVVAGAMFWQATARHRRARGAGLRAFAPAIAVALVALALAWLIDWTGEDFRTRREASNVGRYVLTLVALRAISDAPLIGHGSWTVADAGYTRMMRDEVLQRVSDASTRRYVEDHPVRSLMPHSQLIQAWLEGGLLGMSFFLLYGVRIVRAMCWFAMRHPLDAVGPVYVYFLVYAAWNLAASPFLGMHRLYIAVAVAITMLAAHERLRHGRWPAPLDSGTPNRVSPAH